LTNRDFFSLSPEHRRDVITMRDEYEALFTSAVTAALQDGSCQVPYPAEAVRAVLAMCSAVANWYRPDGEWGPDEVADRYSRLCLNMIEAAPLVQNR
jgi:hypothetical protein